MVSVFKKSVAYVLVLALMLTSAGSVFATGSGQGSDAPKPTDKAPVTQPVVKEEAKDEVKVVTVKGVSAEVDKDNNATVTAVKSNKKTVKVAAKLDGAKVTVIGADAFKNCKKATKVVLPKTVKTIKANAFKGAKKLKTIDLKIKKSIKVEKGAFKGLKTKKMTIKVGKMSKKELKKFKKALKKAGFKGKVKAAK